MEGHVNIIWTKSNSGQKCNSAYHATAEDRGRWKGVISQAMVANYEMRSAKNKTKYVINKYFLLT